MARSEAYKEEIAAKIIKYIAAGDSQRVAATKAGITVMTFHNWRKRHQDFAERVRQAEIEHKESDNNELLNLARKSLKDLITGFEYKEIKEEKETGEDGLLKTKKRVEHTRKVAPNTTAVIFVLTNLDSQNWKNIHTANINADIKNEHKADLSKIPDELMQEVMNRLQESDKESKEEGKQE